MPELAEVAYYARRWDAAAGEKIHRVHTGSKARFFRNTPAAAFTAGLTGQTYAGARTQGKNLLFEFSGGLWMTGHLGMTGELLCGPPDHVPERHDHLVLHTRGHALIFRDFRMFGAVSLEESPGQPPESWLALPPEIHAPGFSPARVSQGLLRHSRQPLKAFLLDQAWFPGIGNWMADEACWQLRLHPATLCGQVDGAALRKTLRAICKKSMETIAVDWSDPPATWLMRHRWKDGGFCPRCGSALVRATLRGRTACWCPACQPEPSPQSG